MADKYNEHTDSIALEDVRFLFPYDNILYASFLSHTTWLASFDTDDVDVVLRSSDNVDFLAHKTILSVASPIFKMVFRMPQPVVYEDGAIHPETGLPLVPLEEDHRTLDILLRMCYPCHRTTPLLLDDIRPMLRAAHKYELEQIITQIRGILTMFMPAEPLRVFTIACNMGWEREARMAARLVPYAIPADLSSCRRIGLDQITSGHFFRLVKCQRTSSWAGFRIDAPNPPLSSKGLGGDMACPISIPILDISDQPADIIIRSSDRIEFYAHKTVLSMSSRKLAHIVRQESGPTVDSNSRPALESDRPVVEFTESGRVLGTLLRLCYPIGTPKLDYDDVAEVLEAANKYEVPRAIEVATKKLTEYIRGDPLRAYFVAFAHGWMDEAKEAAKHAVFLPKDRYVPEMESASAEAYWRLLDYRRRTAAAITNALALNDTMDPSNAYNTKALSKAFDEANGFNTCDRFDIGELLKQTTKAGLGYEAIIASIAQVVVLQCQRPMCSCAGPSAMHMQSDARAIVIRIMELQGRLDEEFSKVPW